MAGRWATSSVILPCLRRPITDSHAGAMGPTAHYTPGSKKSTALSSWFVVQDNPTSLSGHLEFWGQKRFGLIKNSSFRIDNSYYWTGCSCIDTTTSSGLTGLSPAVAPCDFILPHGVLGPGRRSDPAGASRKLQQFWRRKLLTSWNQVGEILN